MKIKNITANGILLALALALSFLESFIPPIPFLPPNAKMGLANVVVMYSVFFAGYPSALNVTLLKALFVLITRGAAAGLLSLSGGLMSLAVIILIKIAAGDRATYITISISGAIAHNMGQIFAASLLMGSFAAVGYLPFSVITGIVFGILTGGVLRAAIPAMRRLENNDHTQGNG
ncbi:MAG: Gx transporter family protein [Oscillospiraceae bacterium]|nr:Gx transporter family protein [Oscillospiraceae bacterium]